MTYHNPVLLQECLEGLDIKENGIYVDGTFGGGGHSKEILKRLKKGKLFGFDQDKDTKQNIIKDERFIFIHANFRNLKQQLEMHQAIPIDGLLVDLGVSSYQIDAPGRGFSTRFDGPLDMRMDDSQSFTAAEIVNTYDAPKLQQVFSEYGEVRNSKTLAERIVAERELQPINTTQDLKRVADLVAKGNRNRYYAQIFQALRIAVNDELGALKDLMQQASEILKQGGRLAIISFHSLEDRIVKNFMKYGETQNIAQDLPSLSRRGKGWSGDQFLNSLERNEQSERWVFKMLTKKPITASEEEIRNNPRARSAKLRIAEKI